MDVPRASIALLLALLAETPALAGPPETGETDTAGAETGPTETEPTDIEPVNSAIPELIDEGGGFWLSVELLGPRGAQIEAARRLATPPVQAGLPRGGRPPPGELVGRVETIEEALAWVDTHAFAAPAVGFSGAPHPGPAPIPGGDRLVDQGLHLTALVVTAGAPTGGTRDYPWPGAALTPAPAGADWRPATLTIARTPLFAAPAPVLPPAAERYLIADREQDLWLLGELERCDDARQRCLRWAQVLTRDGERFAGGWLPAWQVVVDDDWIPSDDGRAFAVRPGHHTLDRAGLVLIERRVDDDGVAHHRVEGLQTEHVGPRWPAMAVTVLAGTLNVHFGDAQLLSRLL